MVEEMVSAEHSEPSTPPNSDNLPQSSHASLSGRSGLDHDRPLTRLSHFAACGPCRKRKLRCDGKEPECGTCVKANRECLYQDVRKGVRKQRTSIKILEARLAELEAKNKTLSQGRPLLDTRQAELGKTPQIQITESRVEDDGTFSVDALGIDPSCAQSSNDPIELDLNDSPTLRPAHLAGSAYSGSSSYGNKSGTVPQHDSTTGSNVHSPAADRFALLGQGLEESLPSKDAQDDLNRLYFSNIHKFAPVLHQGRFLAGLGLPTSSSLRPPYCLCYIVWALGAACSDAYRPFKDIFYQRARKYADLDEMRSRGEQTYTVAHTQTWALLAMYEQSNMLMARGFLSGRKASALCIATGLHKLDGVGLAMHTSLCPPAGDWVELEQRRRTFWMVYIQDRFLSSGSGWPVAIDDQDVSTFLPSDDTAFANGTVGRGMTLWEGLTPAGARSVSRFATTAIMASLLGRILLQLHRPGTGDKAADDQENRFWKNYREIDNILLNSCLSFPEEFTSRSRFFDPDVVLLNLMIQSATIGLHQSAHFFAGKNPRLAELSTEAKKRCMAAAREMVSILQDTTDDTLAKCGPFAGFTLYTGARVMIFAIKQNPAGDVETLHQNLRFLISKLQWIRKFKPFIQVLLLQLDVDLEGIGVANPTGYITTMGKIREQEQVQALCEDLVNLDTAPSDRQSSVQPGAANTVKFTANARADANNADSGTTFWRDAPIPAQQPHPSPQPSLSQARQPLDHTFQQNMSYGSNSHGASTANIGASKPMSATEYMEYHAWNVAGTAPVMDMDMEVAMAMGLNGDAMLGVNSGGVEMQGMYSDMDAGIQYSVQGVDYSDDYQGIGYHGVAHVQDQWNGNGNGDNSRRGVHMNQEAGMSWSGQPGAYQSF